jgi:hypothetical protein
MHVDAQIVDAGEALAAVSILKERETIEIEFLPQPGTEGPGSKPTWV